MKINAFRISGESLKELEKIAMECDCALAHRGDILPHGNDAEDFPEVSVTAIQAMLEKAYLQGRRDALAHKK